jgi:hypothetical protein
VFIAIVLSLLAYTIVSHTHGLLLLPLFLLGAFEVLVLVLVLVALDPV